MEGSTELPRPQEPEQENLKPENQSLEAAKEGRLRRLKDWFNRVFSKEQKQGEKFPKMSIDIFLSHHETAQDIKGFEEKFKNADIYIPEMRGWTQEVLDLYRAVADGRVTPKEAKEEEVFKDVAESHLERELDVIYKSEKPITIIDVPSNDPLIKKREKLEELEELSLDLNTVGDFSGALDSTRNYLKQGAADRRNRKDYMVFELGPKIKELVEANDKLKNKKEINALLSLGSSHRGVYHNFERMYKNVTREFNRTPISFGYFDEGLRRVELGKEIDDDLASKAFLQLLLDHPDCRGWFRGVSDDSIKVEKLRRKVISHFSLEEVKEVFERLKQGESKKQIFEGKFGKREFNFLIQKKNLMRFWQGQYNTRLTLLQTTLNNSRLQN